MLCGWFSYIQFLWWYKVVWLCCDTRRLLAFIKLHGLTSNIPMDCLILFTLLILPNIVDMRMQPVTCNEDIHCSVGFFCHTRTHSCRECLSCDHLRRRPGPIEYDCITSEQQCGPCLQGFVNDETNWGDMCLSLEAKHMKILTSYMYILMSCVASGILISLFIIHGIWNTQIIKVNIACKTSETPISSNLMKNPNAFTA